jgi:hypothetical protein
MRGEVEIWRGDTLVSREPNMLVDGAGELLADIMTVSPSLSGITDTATSSILDSSNYTIQAISFGTGKDAFLSNAHALDQYKENYLVDEAIPSVTVTAANALPSIVWLSSIDDLSGNNNIVEGKSYHPVVGLPVPPDPMLTVLEEDTSISSVVGGTAVSSIFPGNGQLTNFMPSAILSALMEPTVFSSTTSAVAVGILMGAFPDGSSGLFGNTNRHFVFVDGNPTALYSPQFRAGVFNEVSSMDVSGFVNMIMSSVPDASYSMSSTYSGLCMSANSTFATDGIVEYSVTLAAGDVGYANAFGGIYHLGLWAINIKQSLLNGNTPPFSFSVLNNPRKYKLFARKGLSKNLCYINDNGSISGQRQYTDLTIKWRLHFL